MKDEELVRSLKKLGYVETTHWLKTYSGEPLKMLIWPTWIPFEKRGASPGPVIIGKQYTLKAVAHESGVYNGELSSFSDEPKWAWSSVLLTGTEGIEYVLNKANKNHVNSQ